MSFIRGLESKHEQRPHQILRDTRTFGQRFWGFITQPQSAALTIGVSGAAALLMPNIADVALVIGICVFLLSFSQKSPLPFRMPQRSHAKDPNDPLKGSNKPGKARGIAFFGNERSSNQELWFNNEDMRTHVLIFGSTGSGKTEALISLAYNALVQGSGFIYVDGKGDNSLFAKLFSMARRMGREDDVLLVNFMTGARDVVGPQKTRLSNTMNPFATGSSSMLTQLVVSLMDAGSASPDGDMWKNRAIAFVEALMKILVYARDKNYILLDANTIRRYFLLQHIESIAIDKRFPVNDEQSVDIADAPEVVVEPVKNYLNTLPGYDKSKKHKQTSETLEQHGFITMQLTRVFSSLADTYGHIMRTKLAEVDFKDVVLNRRILIVLLPALEKSPDELANLGKVIVSSLKAMMAAGLGDEVEGSWQDVIERKPTNSPTPYLCILDEYGYYAVKGFSVVPAQARSLGFSAIFAGQDLPAFQKASKEEAASIGANTNIKIAMKLEDPLETWDFFLKTAGEADVSKSGGFQIGANSMTNSYMDTKSAQIERRARIDLRDLKDQREGEAHIFFKSNIVRARMFFANPKPVKHMRLNQFLKISTPSDETLINFAKRLKQFEQIFANPVFLNTPPPQDDDINFVAASFNEAHDGSSTQNALAVLASFHMQSQGALEADTLNDTEEVSNDNEIDIFTKPAAGPEDEFDFMALLDPKSTEALLSKQEMRRAIEQLERLGGKSKVEAAAIATNLLEDVHNSTQYPPETTPDSDADDITDIIQHLTGFFGQMNESQSPPESE